MQLFYIPQITGDLITLPEDESKHCIRVLRMTKGDELDVVDGIGNLFHCAISDPNPKRCVATILNKREEFGKRSFDLHIAIAPTKNIERFEWFLEKATEIGIDRITPLLCEHSERKSINPERLERIVVSAMKQSGKAYLPDLLKLISFKDLIRNANEDIKLIAYCGDYSFTHIKNYVVKGQSVIILIGPEGDFSPEEVNFAVNHGFTIIGLGESRLRTETAGVVACTIANVANE